MNYRVKITPDDMMPGGKPWVICRHDDTMVMYLARSNQWLDERAKEQLLEEAWAGYRGMPGVTLPAQRASA